MTARRSGGGGFDQAGTPGYQRIMARLDEQGEDMSARLESFFSRTSARLDRIEGDIGALDLRHSTQAKRITSDLDELKRDLGETRDKVALSERNAVAAATDAAPTAAAAASNLTISALPKTWWGKLIIAATGFTTIMVALNNIPDAARGWDRFMTFLRNEPPAVVRPHGEPVVQPKQDTTSSK